MTFTEFVDRAAQAFEVFAVAVLIVGMVWSLVYSAWVWRTPAMGALAICSVWDPAASLAGLRPMPEGVHRLVPSASGAPVGGI
jgi:hypothetical protein